MPMLGQNPPFFLCTSSPNLHPFLTLFTIFFSLSLHSCLLSLLKPSLSPLIPPRFSISTLPLRSLQIIPYRDSSNSHFISPNTSILTKIPSSLLTHTHLLSHLNLFPFSQLTPFQCEQKEREGKEECEWEERGGEV